ncbi:tetratricopeptide repeat protein [Granulicella cerasi]|uniref:Tetratricopeptide repeat protein n=1 Tax=Granulicella cerasi TaxID=741063 RepID=A0ABW1Z7N4_9BACT|nr:tetratricopeptide repeat protein [Granulicella cerasi]
MRTMKTIALAAALLAAPCSFAQAQTASMKDAEAALEKGDFATAETLLLPLSQQQPANAQVLYDLGFAQERNGKDDAAANSYAAAAKADAKMAEPRIALGLLQARSGQSIAAHASLAAAADIPTAPPKLRAKAYRALAQLDAEDHPADASDELLKAIDLDGEHPADLQLTGELAERSGDLPHAEQSYVKALAANPESIDARVGLAHAMKQQGRSSEAEDVLRTGLKSQPDDLRLITQLASVLLAEDKAAEAIPLLEQLRAANPQAAQDATLANMLAHLYDASDQPAKAEALYRSQLAQHPSDPILLDALGSSLVRQAKFAEAESLLAKAASERAAFHDDKLWAEAATHLAFAASRNNHPQLTLQALAARGTILPDTASTLFLSATANDSLHKRDDAVRLYKAFLAVANGKYPTEEFQARHRLVALQHER